MKRSVVFVICLVLSLLCACDQSSKRMYSENELYKMYTEDGKWYIEFIQPADGGNTGTLSTNQIAITYPQFDSVTDFANMLKSGNIPDDCIRSLKRIGNKNVVEICDPNKICDLKTPNSLIYDHVSWIIDIYKFSIKAEKFRGYVECFDFDQEQYAKNFEEYLDFPNEHHTVTSEMMVEDRDARVVYSYTSTCEQKNILYKITAAESEIYVKETYILRYFDERLHRDGDVVSETVPNKIEFFGNDGTHYWHAWFWDFEERPSVEWLSSFGLEPLE